MSLGKKVFIVSCFFFLTILSLFLFRNALLDYVIQKVADRITQKSNIVLEVKEKGFQGIRNIYVNEISLVQPGKDTLLSIGSADVRISLSSLFRFKIRFDEIYADQVQINIVKYNDSTSNFENLFRKDKNIKDSVKSKSAGYNEIISSILFKANELFNENIILQAVQFNYTARGLTEQLRIPQLLYDKKTIKASMITTSSDGVASYILSGSANAETTTYNFRIIRNEGDKASLPFLHRFDDIFVTFDTLNATLQADPDESPVPLIASLQFKNLILNHWRISPVDVLFFDLRINLKALFDDDRISIDKGTKLLLKSLPININGFYERKPERKLAFNMDFNTKSEQFFESLPAGMFNTLKGFDASGKLSFKLITELNVDKPEEVKFSSSFKKENFRINSFGAEYFPIINNDFQFTALDGDRAVRSIFVGDQNPMFTRSENIAPFLRLAVLTCEDPSFMNHNGFVEESFRESLVQNIKERRFARGGSTISMQLVKNLFLSRNKAISRKLEEALIVWIIEQNRLVSKERMLEVYLNIIEWGPDVYGIGEASRFYFSKLPSELDLSESIFLASIIPHPKYFKYMFDSTGTLKETQKGFYTLVGNRMLSRNLITQPELDQLNPAVKLNGMALNKILPMETMPVDSLIE
jgi:Transglycosylase